MKILLTGATGYIGSAVLTALLDRSHEVLAPVRSAGSLVTTRSGGPCRSRSASTSKYPITPTVRKSPRLAAIHSAIGVRCAKLGLFLRVGMFKRPTARALRQALRGSRGRRQRAQCRSALHLACRMSIGCRG